MEKSIKSNDTKILLEMLYQLRVTSGLRQLDLAKMLNVHQSFVSKIESGERQVDLIELRKILTCFNTNLFEFVLELEKRISESRK